MNECSKLTKHGSEINFAPQNSEYRKFSSPLFSSQNKIRHHVTISRPKYSSSNLKILLILLVGILFSLFVMDYITTSIGLANGLGIEGNTITGFNQASVLLRIIVSLVLVFLILLCRNDRVIMSALLFGVSFLMVFYIVVVANNVSVLMR